MSTVKLPSGWQAVTDPFRGPVRLSSPRRLGYQWRMQHTDQERGGSTYDLVIVGGTAGGLSVAVSSLRAGLGLVRIVEPTDTVAFPELVHENTLDVGFGETIRSIDVDADGEHLLVTTDRLTYRTRGAMVAQRQADAATTPVVPVEASAKVAEERIHLDALPDGIDDLDVLVIGHTDRAVELMAQGAAAGGRMVLAGGGIDPGRLSPAGENLLRRLERERRATMLYRSVPDGIGEAEGFPMAYFNDRRTPDLQFDHVVFATSRRNATPAEVGATDAALATGKLWFLGEPTGDDPAPTAPGWNIGPRIAEACFPEIDAPGPSDVRLRARHTGVAEELREEHYNATITHFEPTHSDLWVLRVRPDTGGTSHLPGQYASLGLGYWEDRVDDAEDPGLDEKWDKLIRRSYSISSRMFDDHGYLTDHTETDELEFYIVLVSPTPDNVPALTPRLALKRPGDRIYLGPKVAGRYTLNSVVDPEATCIFLGTGTGEAPHNAMVVELLRKGHVGPIVSAVSVRQWADLGYRHKHGVLEARYPNYHYVPMPTREADVPKRYIQDLISSDEFSTLGVELDPATTHVFLCGNPSMIGLPEEEDADGNPVFPETVGVVQLLTEQGFTLDKRNSPGNIHYEEYW